MGGVQAMGRVHLVASEQGLDPDGGLVPHVDLLLKSRLVLHVVLLPCLKIFRLPHMPHMHATKTALNLSGM